MAFFSFKDVRIAGIAAGVPCNIIENDNKAVNSANYDASAFIQATGVRRRHVSNDYTASDLGFIAAEKLINDLGWDKSEIDILIFVSQHADYILPATSCILQDRLGLSKECYTEDIALGCSGWVYGISNAASLLASGSCRKALVICGDAKRRTNHLDGLFGHAGTVTALEYKEGEDSFNFHFGTDGSGFEAIIIPDGGSRNQITPESFVMEEVEGKIINKLQPRMKGIDVFGFGITAAPRSIKRLIERFNLDINSFDYFIFHQANLMMNEKIRKKLKLPSEKVPYSMPDFGNTSSASIPLTIVSQLRGKIENRPVKFMCCGFGVGLSWATVAFSTKDLVIPELIMI